MSFSGRFLHERDFKQYLGGIETDESGRIVKAKATFIRWFGRANTEEAKRLSREEDEGLGMEQQPVI